jgi:hypothetical protein
MFPVGAQPICGPQTALMVVGGTGMLESARRIHQRCRITTTVGDTRKRSCVNSDGKFMPSRCCLNCTHMMYYCLPLENTMALESGLTLWCLHVPLSIHFQMSRTPILKVASAIDFLHCYQLVLGTKLVKLLDCLWRKRTQVLHHMYKRRPELLIMYVLPPRLWPILFTNTNISRHILVINIFILVKSNKGRREY